MTAVYITGCARSGTKYLATVAQAAGIDATHEASRIRHGEPLLMNGTGAVEVNSDGGTRIGEIAALDEVKVIGHVVRDPALVVASIVGRGMWNADWGEARLREYPQLEAQNFSDDGKDIDRTLAYWILHNRRISARAKASGKFVLRFTLGEAEEALTELCDRADVPLKWERLSAAVDVVPLTINRSESHPPLSYHWEDHNSVLREFAERSWRSYEGKVAA